MTETNQAAGRSAGQSFDATLGLGTNMGDRAGNIAQAISLLTRSGKVRLAAVSRLYKSPPWGVIEQEPFLNACIAVKTDLTPHQLLSACQSVENEMGRVRKQKWGPRLIDVDILTYRDCHVNEPDLIIPHPYIAQRAFVLLPLRDIAPDMQIGGQSLLSLIAHADTTGVVAADGALRSAK
jgi:2-amino-4-hydroxy-6-hydroxymethyldihydropteridine diphosphokinase